MAKATAAVEVALGDTAAAATLLKYIKI